MISVICTQCRAQLDMDDAFAGGVCRCQYCGTIQTVPPLSRLKKRQAAPEAAQTPQPAGVTPVPQGIQGGVAPRPQGVAPQADSGLDALAEAVASSSGLGRGSLRAGPAENGAAPAPPTTVVAPPAAATPASAVDYARPVAPDRRRTVVIAALAALAAVIVFFLGAGYVLVGRATTATVPLVTPTPNPTPPPRGGGEGDGGEGGDAVVPRHPHFC